MSSPCFEYGSAFVGPTTIGRNEVSSSPAGGSMAVASPAPSRSRRVTKIGITFCTWLFSPIFCSNFHFEVGGTNVFSASSAARRKCFSTAWFMSCDSLIASPSVSILNQVPFGPSHTNCIRPPLGKASRGIAEPPSYSSPVGPKRSRCRSRPMGSKKGADMAHRKRNLVRGVLPWVKAYLRVGCEMYGLHRDGIWVPRNIVRQHQDRRLAFAHEIARHGVHEVGARTAVHVGQERTDHRHRDIRPAGAQLRAPALHVVVVREARHLRTVAAGLRWHSGDDAVARPLQQIPDERTADAEAKHHELADAQMIHHADLV